MSIANDLHENILNEYVNLAECHKNSTYSTANTVSDFVQVIGKRINENSVSLVRAADHLTIPLDESIDDSNHSELSSISLVKYGVVVNYFLDLIQFKWCDTKSIFKALFEYMERNCSDITQICFGRMDDCSP